MRLTTPVTFVTAFLGAALALELPTHVRNMPPNVVERDLPTITKVVNDADARIKELTSAVQGFNGDPTQLVGAATNMVNTLNQGIADVTNTSAISLNDAITLQGQVTGLQTDANALISALNDKKNSFEQAGLCDVVFKQSQGLGGTAKKLIDAVVAKVPQEVQALAGQVVQGFNDSLNQTTQAFAPGNCTNRNGAVNGGSGSGTGSGSTSGNSSARPSSAAPAAVAGASGFRASLGLLGVVLAACLVL